MSVVSFLSPFSEARCPLRAMPGVSGLFIECIRFILNVSYFSAGGSTSLTSTFNHPVLHYSHISRPTCQSPKHKTLKDLMAHFITPTSAHTDYLNTEISDLSDEDEIDLGNDLQESAIKTNGVASYKDTESYSSQSGSASQRPSRRTSDHSLSVESQHSTNAHLRSSSSSHCQCDTPPSSDTILNGIFTVDGGSYDVSLFRDRIVMQMIGISRKS